MKSFFWSLIFIFCTWSLFFIGKGVDNIDIMSERYKRALDAGANAAASYRAYNTEKMIDNQGTGFGNGLENSRNIMIDRKEALQWFYRLFYRNLGITDLEAQNKLKKYIVMKALICYDRLMIADAMDNWLIYDPAGEKEYIVEYRGKDYKFTLSEEVYDIENKNWLNISDIGIEPEEKTVLLTQYITSELNSFLDNRGNKESGNYYKIVFSIDNNTSEKLSGIEGINFIVFSEGVPLPALNPFKREKFYAYGIGGSEISRMEYR